MADPTDSSDAPGGPDTAGRRASQSGRPVAWSVRPRLRTDLGACVGTLERVHEQDRYPLVWPADPQGWLSPADALGAWVGGREGRFLGHVMLRPASGPPLPVWEAATGVGPDRLAVVSRLFVDPGQRRSGLGRALLDAAVGEAHRRSFHPVLDVLHRDRGATRLYEREGWTRVGQFVWSMPDGSEEPAWAYVLRPGRRSPDSAS